ncbi:MAG: pyrimidine-nucleoside phosphorylase, partial [Anaerolineae bacterium]|nr:pyrimidine-nucleoside phosphorylase [Anaerolineae bacterium]
ASGRAWEKFRQMIAVQGGDLRFVDEPSRFFPARLVQEIQSTQAGYLARVQTDQIGMAVVGLGGGREEKGDVIDHAVGLEMLVEVGDQVAVGETVFIIHANDEEAQELAVRRILSALHFSAEKVEPLPLFYQRIQ